MDSKTVVMVLSVVLFCSFLLVDDCLGQSRTWSSRDGKHKIEGAVERVDKEKGNVVLRLKDGTKRSVSISDLSKKDQTYIAFKFDVKVDKDFRVWTSSKGKKIRATLLKFENNKVYLKSPEGKIYAPIPFDRLSFADQNFVNPQRRVQPIAKGGRYPIAKGGRYLTPVPAVDSIIDIALKNWESADKPNKFSLASAALRMKELDVDEIDECVRGLCYYTYQRQLGPQRKKEGINPRIMVAEILEHILLDQTFDAKSDDRNDAREAAEVAVAKEVLENSRNFAERGQAFFRLTSHYAIETSSFNDGGSTYGKDCTEEAQALIPLQRELLESGNSQAEFAVILSYYALAELSKPNQDLLEACLRKHFQDTSRLNKSLSNLDESLSRSFGE